MGFAQYRFRRFCQVENGTQACLAAFVYLEWYRARQLARAGLPEKAKSWWRRQRSYGLSRAAMQTAEEYDLAQLLRWAPGPACESCAGPCARRSPGIPPSRLKSRGSVAPKPY